MTRESFAAYLHIDGFDTLPRDAFNKRKVRAGFRKAGRLVAGAAQMSIALARSGDGYPVSRTGRLIDSIRATVSRSGFMVKVAPSKVGGMADYYPAYLHYGVKQGSRVKALAPGKGKGRSNRRAAGARAAETAERQGNDWRITPRDNYMTDALDDTGPRVRMILTNAFAASLFD